ncbi:MAG: ATP-binding protein [Paludibacter sp.]|nr:ATP-binding protein [Paludibacter sp.]
MDSKIIQGNPTKSFFIQMITRDITINDAIVDLLDNSIDGASRLNPNDYSGLRIDLILNKNEFVVKDNCGGFTVETAQKYAFRFGRPDDAPETSGSVGRFGIGMKRALFKMGKNFIIESKTKNEHFNVNVDVEQWKNKTAEITLSDGNQSIVDDWNFSYENVTDNYNLLSNGTFIKVSNLFSEVSDLFDDVSFLNSLRNDIERLLNFSLEKKIEIFLNNQKLSSKDINIFNDAEGSKPYFVEGKKNNVKFESPLITPIFQKVEKCIILGFYTLLFWLQVQTQ